MVILSSPTILRTSITGIVLAYFADGIYQFLFLFILGGANLINYTSLMITGGVDVKNTIDLNGIYYNFFW